MKRLLYWLYLLVKRQLKNPVIVVVLIAMPVAALIITNTASLKEKEPVRVGIVLEDDDKIAKIINTPTGRIKSMRLPCV